MLATSYILGASGKGDSAQNVASAVVLDAGVIFSGQSHLICLPLPSASISRVAQAERVQSSCDCVEIDLIDYADAYANPRCAVLIQFDAMPRDPQELLIDVTVDLVDDESFKASVNVVFAAASNNAVSVLTEEVPLRSMTPVPDAAFFVESD